LQLWCLKMRFEGLQPKAMSPPADKEEISR
jgi:hypothetical protein